MLSINSERESLYGEKILQTILNLVNQGHVVSFTEDWGGNSITLIIDNQHTHCGYAEGDFETLTTSLHNTLVKGCGLSFAPSQKEVIDENKT